MTLLTHQHRPKYHTIVHPARCRKFQVHDTLYLPTVRATKFGVITTTTTTTTKLQFTVRGGTCMSPEVFRQLVGSYHHPRLTAQGLRVFPFTPAVLVPRPPPQYLCVRCADDTSWSPLYAPVCLRCEDDARGRVDSCMETQIQRIRGVSRNALYEFTILTYLLTYIFVPSSPVHAKKFLSLPN